MSLAASLARRRPLASLGLTFGEMTASSSPMNASGGRSSSGCFPGDGMTAAIRARVSKRTRQARLPLGA